MEGHVWQGVCVAREVCMVGVCVWQGGWSCMAGEMATVADDTHPTGMYSCSLIYAVNMNCEHSLFTLEPILDV